MEIKCNKKENEKYENSNIVNIDNLGLSEEPKSEVGVINDDSIHYNSENIHSFINDEVEFYDVKGIDETKEKSENIFNVNENFGNLDKNIYNFSLDNESYNSNIDDDLENFFREKSNEIVEKKNETYKDKLEKGDDFIRDDDYSSSSENKYDKFYKDKDYKSSLNNEVNEITKSDGYKNEDSENSFLRNTINNECYEHFYPLGSKKNILNTNKGINELSIKLEDNFSHIGNKKNDDVTNNFISEMENENFYDEKNDLIITNDLKKEKKIEEEEEEKEKEDGEEKKEEEDKEDEEEKEEEEEKENLSYAEKETLPNDKLLMKYLNNSKSEADTNFNNEKITIEKSNLFNEKNMEEQNNDIKNEKSKKINIMNYLENNDSQDNINNSKSLLKKKRVNEDQTNPLWYKHKRHFFIFTYSGKPVFTRYGNEENLTSFYGTLLAIISKIESFCFSHENRDIKINKKINEQNTKNTLKYIISKNTKVVYLDKGVLYLVCISKVNESNNYILNILNYIYFQIISLLTKSIDKSFQIKPSFDIRYLLDGADLLISNLISSCSKNMYSIFDGFEPLPLKQEYRNQVHNWISNFKINNVLLSFLIINDKIICLSISKYTIYSMDIIILINMITSMKSFKNAESWTPICLPIYNPNLFLYAYINYIRKKICCVYVCSYASPRDFFYLSRHTSTIESMLMSTGCYDEIVKASDNSPFTLPEIHGIDIIHLCYYIPYLKQYYSSKISHDKIKRIFRVYQKCDDILKDSKLPAQIYIECEYEKFYCIKTNLYHLYLSVPFHVKVNDDSINEILRVIAIYHKEIFINNIKQITF
ncbi:vacuolar fusion protein MON1, putative [Plasmodium gallinaceum]|uniref:Vacuolar fusion protein MON1, putative n=1 Tax=Plasmodium gallinaceum TaxID=5849 RepID=A0A1J1GRU9_PLAGA|nr:vacuolar fusion protein MON1, putative [Plasmodium gallinaceum]CRG95234.1 vacuolar fusion protein MON1, putative [Plasmodium gallinaceum]